LRTTPLAGEPQLRIDVEGSRGGSAPLRLAGHPDGTAVRAALANASPLATVTLVGRFAH